MARPGFQDGAREMSMGNRPSTVVVIGHLGFESVRTPQAARKSLGGSAYYTALGAAVVGGSVSVISSVGDDFPLEDVRAAGVDVSHVRVASGKSPFFEISYLPTLADRTLSLDLGVGSAIAIPDAFDFSGVGHVHVATNLPQTQLEFIERLRVIAPAATVSTDCFDQFVVAYPRATCRAVAAADLVFANTLEYDLLLRMCDPPREVVVKKGAQGAVYRSSGQSVAATAPIVDVVDPTGAGDAFAGAYLARRLDGASHAAALSDACRVGAAAVESFGADALLRAAPRLRQRLGDGSPDA